MIKNKIKIEDNIDYRSVCYNCYRPKKSCMCKYINKIDTSTQFIILMHPKEYRKTKNGTGYFTHKSLSNSKLFIGIDFTNHAEINKIISDKNNSCYILYPDKNSIKLNTENIKIQGKKSVIFIIDSTWPCSKKMLRVSKNLQTLPYISFEHTKHSAFKIKTQPSSYCLSTIESTLCILELLNKQGIENISQKNLDSFLNPFYKMVEYQVGCSLDNRGSVRYKVPYKRV